jgi:hypothetical protein
LRFGCRILTRQFFCGLLKCLGGPLLAPDSADFGLSFFGVSARQNTSIKRPLSLSGF